MITPIYHTGRTLYPYFMKHPSVCTDSRKLKIGDIFVALQGPSFDGNDFALNALKQGASFAIVSRPELVEADTRCLLVEDTLLALQDLARTHREALDIPVVAITGTNGKTTTKELTYAVLRKRYKVLATEGNLNNHIGVPLTLLKLTREHEVAIVEMGASGKGEIELLASIAQPTMGLITNVGKAHLEGFGSQQGVLQAKSELFEYLEANGGRYLLNDDDPLLRERWYREGVDTYGMVSTKGDTHLVEGMPTSNQGFLTLCINTKGECREVKTHLVGNYNTINVLAATTVGVKLGLKLDEIKEAIEGYIPSNNRSQLVELERGISVILDCYNANPSSMRAALENLSVSSEERKMGILGDMLELGTESEREHQEVILWLVKHPEIEPILVGREFGKALDHCRQEALKRSIQHFENSDALSNFLKSIKLQSDTVILVKGSRGIALERCEPLIVEAVKREGA